MPVSCHFQGCKALLRTVKRRYIKYHAFAFFADIYPDGVTKFCTMSAKVLLGLPRRRP